MPGARLGVAEHLHQRKHRGFFLSGARPHQGLGSLRVGRLSEDS